MNFIAGTVSLFVIVPLIALLVFYFLLVKIIKKRKKAFLFATDITTLFLIYSVYSLILVIWDYSIGWWIILFLILSLSIVTFIFWRVKEEINIKKSFRLVWRFHFLLYFISQISLFLYGIIDRVIKGF